MRTNSSRIPDSPKRLVRKTRKVLREIKNNCKVTQRVKEISRPVQKPKSNANSTRKRISKSVVKVIAIVM